jgi:hypothetical protein
MTVHSQYDADWVVKLDDDVYLQGTRLLLAIEQWEAMNVDYIGCMQHGDVLQEADHRYCSC